MYKYSVHCNRREICTVYNVYFLVLLTLIITSAYLTHIGRISDLCLEIKRPLSDQAGKQDPNSTAENIRKVSFNLLFPHVSLYRCTGNVKMRQPCICHVVKKSSLYRNR